MQLSMIGFSSGTIPQWMDTVRYEDVKHCSDEQPVVLEIVEKFQLGSSQQRSIQPGQAFGTTGAVMPSGADTVVIQEQTRQRQRVFILASQN